MNRQVVAYHEAAHAVVASFLEIRINLVSMEREGHRLGHCEFFTRFPWASRSWWIVLSQWKLNRTTWDDRIIMIYLAGKVAEKLLVGRHHSLCWNDYWTAVSLAFQRNDSPQGVAACLERLELITAELVRTPEVRASIEAVATELLLHHKLQSWRVERIIHQVCTQGLDEGIPEIDPGGCHLSQEEKARNLNRGQIFQITLERLTAR